MYSSDEDEKPIIKQEILDITDDNNTSQSSNEKSKKKQTEKRKKNKTHQNKDDEITPHISTNPNDNSLATFKNKDLLKEYFQKQASLSLDTSSPPPINWPFFNNFDKSSNNDDDESEVFLVTCAENVDVEQLIGQKFKLGKTTTISRENSRYECNSQHSKEHFITLLCPGTAIPVISVKTNGLLKIHEKLDDSTICTFPIPENNKTKVPYPENLTIRHPLYGRDYKTIITPPKDVRKRLKLAEQFACLANASVKLPKKSKYTNVVKEERHLKRKHMEVNTISKTAKIKKQSNDLEWLKQI